MHPTPVFRWSDRDAMLAFVAERSFATLVGQVDGSLVVAQAPVLVDGERLLLHLSRANPLGRAMPVRVVAIVTGPDTYVSPDWYATLDGVPTWSYLSVELEGALEAIDDEVSLLALLDRQSAAYEQRIPNKRPWTTDKLPPALLAAKLKGIIGATLAIESIRGTRKLSQNKTEADRAGVIAALGEHPVAALMKLR